MLRAPARRGGRAVTLRGLARPWRLRFLAWRRRRARRAQGPPRPGRGLTGGAALLALFGCAALIGLEGWHIWSDRRVKLRAVEVSATNLARSLMQHTEDSFELTDIVLLDLAERLANDGTGAIARERLHQLLAGHALGLASGANFFVYDAQGHWVASSLSDLPREISVVDRDYFRHHRDIPGSGRYLGLPVLSHWRNLWIVTLTRRLQNADGSFAGVILASIDSESLSRNFARFELGAGSAIGLLRADGILLARHPFDPRLTGSSFAHAELFRHRLPRADSGAFEQFSPIDQVARITAFQRGERLPLVMTVSVGREAALELWKREAVWRLGVAGLLSTLLALLGLRLVGQAGQRQEAERRLSEREAEFRLLAENSSDLVARVGANGCFRYVSPASQRLFGAAPEALAGSAVMEQVHPGDLAMVTAAIEPLRLGLVEELRVSHRLRHGGGEVWIEAALRATRDAATGAIGGTIVVMRDVTARKAEERQLEALARTDGLTGIANRRGFDEALAREWRRCAREALPVSLLLLDVDRFKLYNDHYGHQQGDATLRAVAQALAAQARRPGDLTARYGGEEMVLLLAGSEAPEALLLAGRARAAIQALAIPHEKSPPFGVVTVSIGVATAWPQPEAEGVPGPEALVAAADGALYVAKRQGRNRVETTETVPPAPPPPPALPDEAARLAVLRRYEAAGIGPADVDLDRITALAARCFGTPTAVVSLVGQDRQDFVSRVGLDCDGTPRADSFCAHTIAGEGATFTVPNAAADWRFAGNPLVTGALHLRFYAAAPLISPEGGQRLGALCIIDSQPRPPLTPAQERLLAAFAALVVDHMEERRKLAAV
ncbi:diguanylate cyclase [Roseomonas sp. 18066]|uniref:diguanylate cyclase n=1 Tax=Roseomonas sp. 18066 TaxID=2681412 RepID=UPI001358DD36|nr:diguanylate cyclase [Roseomonas sp. 18066]